MLGFSGAVGAPLQKVIRCAEAMPNKIQDLPTIEITGAFPTPGQPEFEDFCKTLFANAPSLVRLGDTPVVFRNSDLRKFAALPQVGAPPPLFYDTTSFTVKDETGSTFAPSLSELIGNQFICANPPIHAPVGAICEYCNEAFFRRPYKNNRNRFCSQKCRILARPCNGRPRLLPSRDEVVRLYVKEHLTLWEIAHMFGLKTHKPVEFQLRKAKIIPVIPGRNNRKTQVHYDKARYRERHLIENSNCRIKDFRRVATRYDKLAINFLSAVALATIVAFWI